MLASCWPFAGSRPGLQDRSHTLRFGAFKCLGKLFGREHERRFPQPQRATHQKSHGRFQ